jgi:hypothetical protein
MVLLLLLCTPLPGAHFLWVEQFIKQIPTSGVILAERKSDLKVQGT